MKKLFLSMLAGLLFNVSGLSVFAQNVEVQGDITTDTEWTSDKIYELNDIVYVTNNATLTIKPGTVLIGKADTRATLVITRGAKINAVGTAEQPIVFTSAKPVGERDYGDIGGIILLGKAPVNVPGAAPVIEGGLDPVKAQYGGTDPNDNSGVLKYVRVEFGGYVFQPDKEINSFTFGGVGSGTVLENLQASYGNDDSFEWFGGTVNAKNLVAFLGHDDDFDTDFGFSGNVQFGLGVRDPQVSDVSGSNGFESDNDGNGTDNLPLTTPTFSNFTIIGPRAVGTLPDGNTFKRAAHIRRNSNIGIFNSVLIGYPTGILLDGSKVQTNAETGKTLLLNSYVVDCAKAIDTAKVSTSFDFNNWLNAAAAKNTVLADKNELKFDASAFTIAGSHDYLLQNTSPLVTGADFSNARLGSFFDKNVTYVGAFGTANWTANWTNFDPQNTTYNATTSAAEIVIAGSATVYPNPTNAAAQIRFTLKNAAQVRVTVLNLNGQTVAELANGQTNAGIQNLTFDAANLQTGLYLVKIETESGVKTLKLTVAN